MASSNYPNQIDTDVEIPTIRNNITEIGSDAINSLKSAVINIEKYVGVSLDTTTLTLTNRVFRVIDADGRLRRSAIEVAGLLTAPITNSDVDTNAQIAESKLNLDYSTSSLQEQIDTLRTRQDANMAETLTVATSHRDHISAQKVGAHLAANISYDPTSNTYFQAPSVNPYFDTDQDTVQEAIDQTANVLRRHKEATSTMSTPFGEHYSSAIFFDNTDVSGLTTSQEVQSALEDLFNLYNTNMIIHNDENHANGIVRNSTTLSARAAGFLVYSGASVTFSVGSSVITFAGGTTLITSGVTNGDTVTISGSTSDDGSYKINEVLTETTCSVVGTFKAADGGGASANVNQTSLEGASPAEWSCNCLNCTEHLSDGAITSSEVFVCHPGAAVVIGDEIDFPALAAQINAGNYIIDVTYNDISTPIRVNLLTSGHINNGSYTSLMNTLTVENIVAAINFYSSDSKVPFHAYIKDKNQIIIAHDFAEIFNSSNPESASDSDTIQVEDGTDPGGNNLSVSYLGFSAAQIGVASPSYPNFNNYFYVNGNRRRTLRCITENGSSNYIYLNVDGAVVDTFQTAAVGGTSLTPRSIELRPGDVIRFRGSAAAVDNKTYTVQAVGAVNASLKTNTGVVESNIPVTIYRNVVSSLYESTPSDSTLYRIAVDEEGSAFKHTRLSYTSTASLPNDPLLAIKIVNCSRTLAGSASGSAYRVIVGETVATLFGPGGTFNPADYNSIDDGSANRTRNTLQFGNVSSGNYGEVIQVEPFNRADISPSTTYGFGASRQTYRVYDSDHIDWVDVEVDYNVLAPIMTAIGAPTNVNLTVYEELDDEHNLILSTSLYTNSTEAPASEVSRFVNIDDERHFGAVGEMQLGTEAKEYIWEGNRALGNYVLNGLLIDVDSNNLIWSGGSAYINGHRVDFESGTITAAHMVAMGIGAGDDEYWAVYALEHGEITIRRARDGRPEEEHVVIGMTYVNTSGNFNGAYRVPDYTNLNEKIIITVSQDPRDGMFTDLRQACNYANFVRLIQEKMHDKLLTTEAVGITNGAMIVVKEGLYEIDTAMTLPSGTRLVGVGQPTLRIPATYSTTNVFNVNNNCYVYGFTISPLNGSTVTDGIFSGSSLDNFNIERCRFTGNGLGVNACIHSDNGDREMAIRNCFVADDYNRFVDMIDVSELHIENCRIETDQTNIPAIDLTDCENIWVEGCFFNLDGGARGISVTGSGTPSSSKHIHISGNTFDEAISDYGILLTNVDYANISNNIFNNSWGIYYENNDTGVVHSDVIISNNSFANTSSHCVDFYLDGANFWNLTVIGNRFSTGSYASAQSHQVGLDANLGTENYQYIFILDNDFSSGATTANSHNIYIRGASFASSLNISNNYIAHSNDDTNIRIELGLLLGSNISDNILVTDDSYNIYISSISTDFVISNNVMFNNGSATGAASIHFNEYIERLVCDGNVISSSGSKCLQFSDGSSNSGKIIINNNHLVADNDFDSNAVIFFNMSGNSVNDVNIVGNYIQQEDDAVLIDITNGTNISIANNNILSDSASASSNILQFTSCNRCNINGNVMILDGTGSIINTLATSYVGIGDNIILSNNASAGAQMNLISSYCKINDNMLIQSGSGVVLNIPTTATHIDVVGNVINQSGNGKTFDINSVTYCNIYNNILDNNGDGTVVEASGSGKVNVGSNIFERASSANTMIDFTNVDDFAIDNNMLSLALGSTSSVISLDSACTYGSINSNFVENTGNGIIVDADGVFYLTINSNIFDRLGSSNDMIQLTSVTDFVIDGNILKGINSGSSTFIDMDSSCVGGIITNNNMNGPGMTLIGGTLITNTGTQYMDKLRVAGNYPVDADWTSRKGTESGTDENGADIAVSEMANGGGGTIWIDGFVAREGSGDGTPEGWKMLDDSIDWRYRYVSIATICQPGTTYFPGDSNDRFFSGTMFHDFNTFNGDSRMGVAYFYSNDGHTPVANTNPTTNDAEVFIDNAAAAHSYLVAHATTGALYIYSQAGATDCNTFSMKVDYSPKITE